MHAVSLAIVSASFAILAHARTDLTGCTSTDVSSPAGASVAWYVPGTGEKCDFLDCGGGMAPPKTDVPGCPMYSGTASYSPSYMPGYGASATQAPSAAAVSATSTSSASEQTSSSIWTSAMAASTSASTKPAAGSETPLTSMYTSSASVSTGTTIMTQTTKAAYNGTVPSVSSGGNGTSSNGTITNSTSSPSPITMSTSGAMETARAWAASAGLVMGLGAIVAAL